MTATCATCRFWRRGGADGTYVPGLGDCRRAPPQVFGDDTYECEFPWTDEKEWFGAHEPKGPADAFSKLMPSDGTPV